MTDIKAPEPEKVAPPAPAPEAPKGPTAEEFRALQKQLDATNAKLTAQESLKAKLEEDSLKANQQWQALAERKTAEVEQMKKEQMQIVRNQIRDKKKTEVYAALTEIGLIKTDAVKDDFKNLDLAGVQVETSSDGEIRVLNAKSFSEGVKALKPHWFGQAAPTVNGKLPTVDDPASGAITPKQVYDAEVAYRRSGKQEDYDKYASMVGAYTKQKATLRAVTSN